jgi:hypothetical protein
MAEEDGGDGRREERGQEEKRGHYLYAKKIASLSGTFGVSSSPDRDG